LQSLEFLKREVCDCSFVSVFDATPFSRPS
jgi:hypothetical protein